MTGDNCLFFRGPTFHIIDARSLRWLSNYRNLLVIGPHVVQFKELVIVLVILNQPCASRFPRIALHLVQSLLLMIISAG